MCVSEQQHSIPFHIDRHERGWDGKCPIDPRVCVCDHKLAAIRMNYGIVRRLAESELCFVVIEHTQEFGFAFDAQVHDLASDVEVPLTLQQCHFETPWSICIARFFDQQFATDDYYA